MRQRTTLDALMARPGRVIGTWTQIPHADLIDALGTAGFDFTIIDCEHGAFGIETAESLVRACEAADVVPLVRVPRADWSGVSKALDAGAAGVLVPSIETVDEAARAVAAARFAPAGLRGACPIVRGAAHSATPWERFVREQAGNGVVAMIETAAGLANCASICAVEGLKALLIGPFDLSVALGCRGDVQAEPVRAAVDRLLAAARAAGLPAWMPVFAGDAAAIGAQVDAWEAKGVRCFAVGADKIFVAQALARFRQAAAGEAAVGRPG